MAARLDALGPDALVLFNRFYQPDIDLAKMEVTPSLMLSTQMDMRLPLRWIGILFGKLRANLAATSGIHRSCDVIKMVLAGADVTMLCSVLLRQGIEHLRSLEKEIAEWQRHVEPEELPRPERVRARSIRACAFLPTPPLMTSMITSAALHRLVASTVDGLSSPPSNICRGN